jgi:GTP-binding protein HflX
VEARLARGGSLSLIDLDLAPADGQGLHWLYENAEVMTREASEDGRVHVTVRVPPDKVARVKRRFAGVER